jgi:hypothetical protein
VLAGVTAGFSIASFAGARRTSTALGRLESQTRAPDALVFASQSGIFNPDFAALTKKPEVKNVAVWNLVFGNINGEPGGVLFSADDGQFGQAVDRPVVMAGRMWNPNSTDEIVVDEHLVAQGIHIGTKVRFEMLGPSIDDLYNNNVTGPKVTLTVVGVVREVDEFLFATDGQALLPPGFTAKYKGSAAIHPNADVVLRQPRDVAALRRDVNEIVGPGTPVLDLHGVERRVKTTLSVEHSALLLFALAIALAGGLLVAQALIRSAATIGDDARVLRAMGMSRLNVAEGAGLSHALSAVVAMVTAGATAIITSQWLPLGLGRRIDPDVGVHVDWLALGPGLTLTLLLVAGGAMAVAASHSSLRTGGGGERAGSLLGTIRRRAPLTVGLGATMAFDRGQGRSRVPVLPAIVGAVVGVLGVSCAFTIDHGLRDALSHPERAGVTWDLEALPPAELFDHGVLKPKLAAAVTQASKGTAATIDRELVPVNGVGTPLLSIRALDGSSRTPFALQLVKGRAARGPGEIVIGPATARDIHVKVGDTVQIGDPPSPAKIVGEGLFPTDVHSEFDEGVWIDAKRLDGLVVGSNQPQFLFVAVRLPHGANRQQAVGAVQKLMPDGTTVEAAPQPDEFTNLRHVRTLPVLLAVFLALLAIAALTHVLVSSARRRRRDFAILSAIGLDRRRARLTLNAQGTAIGLVGLLVGVPVGVAVGRIIWRLVTERVPLADVPPFALVATLLILPATALVANGLALWPGYRVAHLRASEELRAE